MNDETEKTLTVKFPANPSPKVSTRKVEIELRSDGSGVVLIDGVAIQSMVRSVSIEGYATKIPTVVLRLTPGYVSIKADAEVFKIVESVESVEMTSMLTANPQP